MLQCIHFIRILFGSSLLLQHIDANEMVQLRNFMKNAIRLESVSMFLGFWIRTNVG